MSNNVEKILEKANIIKVTTCQSGYNGYKNNSGVYEYTTGYKRVDNDMFEATSWTSCDFEDDFEELGTFSKSQIIDKINGFIDGDDESIEVEIDIDGSNLWNLI